MTSIINALIFQSSIILSPSNPYQFTIENTPLWFSNQDIVRLRNSSSHNIIEVLKPGSVHVLGLTKSKDPLKILSVSDQDFNSIKNCPNAPIKIIDSKIYWAESKPNLNLIKKCNFEKLHTNNTKLLGLELQEIEAKLRRQGFLIQASSWESGQRKLIISSSTQREFPQNQIRKTIGALSPFYKIMLRNTPSPGNTLLFQLTLFEFSRDKAEQLGVRWPTQMNIKALEGGVFSGTGDSIIADFGESNGVGKILARPQMRATPGEKARFQSGGELPIKQNTAFAQKTQWKNYGLILELKSSTDAKAGDQEISVEFSFELSEPDESTAIDGVPGMLKRSLESRFDLRVGETTVLSSLHKTRSGHTRNGLWGFQQIPFLSYLFASNSLRNNRSELWFAIKPEWDIIPVPDTESAAYEIKL